MLETILQYWLQTLLGLIAGGLGFLCRKIYKMYKNEKQHQKTEEQEAFYQGLKDAIAEQGNKAIEGDKVLQG